MRPVVKSWSRRIALPAGTLCLGLYGAGAFAQSLDAGKDLPGVDGDFRIVKPQAEVLGPEPDTVPQNGTLKVGNWDVKISGNITVDIGTMKPSSGRQD
jgi:hypothetical protein